MAGVVILLIQLEKVLGLDISCKELIWIFNCFVRSQSTSITLLLSCSSSGCLDVITVLRLFGFQTHEVDVWALLEVVFADGGAPKIAVVVHLEELGVLLTQVVGFASIITSPFDNAETFGLLPRLAGYLIVRHLRVVQVDGEATTAGILSLCPCLLHWLMTLAYYLAVSGVAHEVCFPTLGTSDSHLLLYFLSNNGFVSFIHC